jgi:hypothetical protein
MLKIVTSLSFLYALTIAILLIYGWIYYRDFARSARQRRRFPYVFLVISLACFGFLWINIHAPLQLKTFSNLDHHFIRHDGFIINGSIELGKSDTANFDNNPYNNFILSKKEGQVIVSSPYSEEPFYLSEDGKYKLLSTTFDAPEHVLSLKLGDISAIITVSAETDFELLLNNQSFKATKQVKKGASLWSIFKDEDDFVRSNYYNNERLVNALRQIFVVRNDMAGKSGGDLSYFLSGRLFQYVGNLSYDQQPVKIDDLRFNVAIPDKSKFAWGIGFLSNNKNQYTLQNGNSDSFSIFKRYPVSYPLTEEDRSDWVQHGTSKFLVSDSKDMMGMPAVFREGFLFSVFEKNDPSNFSPVLLTQQKAAADQPIRLKAQWLDKPSSFIGVNENRMVLPAHAKGINWIFSVSNTFNWEYDSFTMNATTWQAILFGSLLVFFLLVFFTSLITPTASLSWVWQLLSCITMVLLTTRFFLYWRYKSFPPYEGMDLPSQQQLSGFSNFGVIIFAAVALAIIFGFNLFKQIRSYFNAKNSFKKRKASEFSLYQRISSYPAVSALVRRCGARTVFFGSWFLVLATACGLAFARNFDPATCRHLAIGLMIFYFIYVYISYSHSPLVAGSESSWWKINTGKPFDIVISNPVKVLLSIALLAVFVFIDIGFAIVFLNFLLFNEAFLCINYAVAGLSAGSRRNAIFFGVIGSVYLLAFILDLLYAPYIFRFLLNLPQVLYLAGYIFFSILLAYNLVRLFTQSSPRKKLVIGSGIAVCFFVIAFLFFPKEKIVDKAAMTKYRIDVLTMPVDKAIESAYSEGKTYEPVIRAAQNQWFINTLIYEGNNPGVNSVGFNLLPHAPQNKGAKYNAQATDLVASRFFLAEHGKWSVLFYVLLLILPTIMLASFYRLYPDFTNRTNNGYPVITAGFSILNYLLITALLVILAATGRYIFFGQDMPFGSILSKQSILFPAILIVTTILLFRNIPAEYYANRKKFIPGLVVFVVLAVLLFFIKPVFNRNKEFNVADLAANMDNFIQERLQPVLDHIDTSKTTRRLPLAAKDRLFSDSINKMIDAGYLDNTSSFFSKEVAAYARRDFSSHLDQSRILYLDLYSGHPQLAINANYFRVEAPPHLQQSWKGNVYGDSSVYNISLLNCGDGSVVKKRVSPQFNTSVTSLCNDLGLSFSEPAGNSARSLYLFNRGGVELVINCNKEISVLKPNDSIRVPNPWKILITDTSEERLFTVEPDAFMRNYYVNGSRFYVYPMGSRFIWARNFAEAIASEYTQNKSNATVSLDAELTDSLSYRIQNMMNNDTAYKKGAEYGVCIADGKGRLIAIADHIKGLSRPDPNDKAGFNRIANGDNGFVSQALLRKQIGNINLLRLNPGPGSTLKPIVFSAIASQLGIDWDAFAAEGFSQKQEYFGGEKVAEYDFEKDNGRINNIADYLKYSDNYYHSNVLLLGSYPKQDVGKLLASSFATQNPGTGIHWPYFSYGDKYYWLDGFENWPGYNRGEVNFGTDSSFTSIGLFANYGIYTQPAEKSYDMFSSGYDSSLFLHAYKRSAFILPEYALFDQEGNTVNHKNPYDVFASCLRGHVKGSSQVMMAPAKMVEAYGKMISQNRSYTLTLDPYPLKTDRTRFAVDNTIAYNDYLGLMREGVFNGMKEALYNGTAAALGNLLKKNHGYYYYAKTGTTGDNEAKTKSKLMVVIISEKELTDPDFNFQENRFYTVYFTLQNGPAKQNEAFQYEIIKFIENSEAFARYMNE